MNPAVTAVARECIASSGEERDLMNFPQQLARLAEVGVEGYYADMRRGTRCYYLPSGESVELESRYHGGPVAERFDPAAVQACIRKAQAGEVIYKDWCHLATDAGVMGYYVSLPGRRVTYFGRTAETHVELFPA